MHPQRTASHNSTPVTIRRCALASRSNRTPPMPNRAFTPLASKAPAVSDRSREVMLQPTLFLMNHREQEDLRGMPSRLPSVPQDSAVL